MRRRSVTHSETPDSIPGRVRILNLSLGLELGKNDGIRAFVVKDLYVGWGLLFKSTGFVSYKYISNHGTETMITQPKDALFLVNSVDNYDEA